MELKDIYGLWDRFESSSLSEIELNFQGAQIHLKRAGIASEPLPSAMPAPAPQPAVSAASQPAAPVSADKELSAPLIGIFYRAAAPGEKPFVEEGQHFSKGDVIGIIEAMKCMNEVVAQEDGCVSRIIAQDGQLVEYDQTLLTYIPTGDAHV